MFRSKMLTKLSVVLIHVLFFHVNHSDGRELFSNLDITYKENIEPTCSLVALKNIELCIDTDLTIYDLRYTEVRIGTVCSQELSGTTRHLVCSPDGTWEGDDCQDEECDNSRPNKEKQIRKRRGWWRRRGRRSPPPPPPPPPLIPPKYRNCPPSDILPVYTAIHGKSVAVTWSEPEPYDDVSISSSVITCCNDYKNGAIFPALPGGGRQHTVTYTATDNQGLTATCQFSFLTKYLSCEAPTIPANGRQVSCTDGYVFGSTCTFQCDNGYEMTGDNQASCLSSETWNQIPTCTKVICPVPTAPANGEVLCDDPSYSFDDDCNFQCNDGFQLIGPQKMTCQADMAWSVAVNQISCTDNYPPVIACQSPQVFYADRGTYITTVSWIEPTATDNVDTDPSITKINGPDLGDELQEGLHYVHYRATDIEGNTSPQSECTVTLEVKVIKCSTGPTDSLDNSRFMLYNCTDTSFYYGVACNLDCDLNLLLNGTDLMTCERDGVTNQGLWKWGSGPQPYCNVVECPPLDPPTNGAIINDTVQLRSINIMACQSGYDISAVGSSFTGRMTCSDSGIWYPLDEFPDCIKAFFPFLFLPAELYYEGSCSDAATQEAIKQQVLTLLTTSQADIDNTICPEESTCKTENLNVVCGTTSRKKRSPYKDIFKRQTESDFVTVTWNIMTSFIHGDRTLPEAYLYNSGLLTSIADKIQVQVDGGHFDIANLTLGDGAFATGSNPDFYCDTGYKFASADVKCKPCPRGTYLDSSTGNCEYCKTGEYMEHDGAVLCDTCPDGYSTLSTGSKQNSSCIRKCEAGFQSATTLEPCSACPVGTYQPAGGQTNCIECPYGTLTPSTNSTSEHACSAFDILVNQLTDSSVVAEFTYNETGAVSLAFWSKRQSDMHPHLAINITDAVGNFLSIVVKDVITINAGALYESSVSMSQDHWTFIVCILDVPTQHLQLYSDNVLVVDESSVPLYNSGTLDLSVGSLSLEQLNSNGVFIAGLAMYGWSLSAAEVSSLSQSCSASVGKEIITMHDFVDSLTEQLVAVTPSICDAIDECKDAPCGDHICINKVDGFECICQGDMTGVLCDIPPDYCKYNECVRGDCVSDNKIYRCNCNDGYTGAFCETPPVNGGWSDWLEWSACDVTCNGGTRQRSRSCNNPEPGYLGNDCGGDDVDIETCNTETCPVCSVLKRKIGTRVTCSDDISTVTVCNMTCVDGKLLPTGQQAFEEYRCGAETAYIWEPIDKVPVCVDASKPPAYGSIARVPYYILVPTSVQDKIGSKVNDALADVGCLKSRICEMQASFSSSTRRKRSAVSTLTIEFNIFLTTPGDIELADYESTGTASQSLSELIEAILAMEEVADLIENNITSAYNIEVDGVAYTVDTEAITVVGLVQCDEGYAATGYLCVQCPAGTQFSDGLCIDCEVGTYQSEPGQSSCNSCPSGYTTSAYGASDVIDCSVVSKVTTTPSQTTIHQEHVTSSGNQESAETLSLLKVAIICTSVTVGVVAVIAIGCVIWKTTISKSMARSGINGSFASLSRFRSRAVSPGGNMHTVFNAASIKTHVTPIGGDGNWTDLPPVYDSHHFASDPLRKHVSN